MCQWPFKNSEMNFKGCTVSEREPINFWTKTEFFVQGGLWLASAMSYRMYIRSLNVSN